jgi:hypothetical protein
VRGTGDTSGADSGRQLSTDYTHQLASGQESTEPRLYQARTLWAQEAKKGPHLESGMGQWEIVACEPV